MMKKELYITLITSSETETETMTKEQRKSSGTVRLGKIMMAKASRDIWRSIVIRYRTHARLCWWVNGRVDGEGFGF